MFRDEYTQMAHNRRQEHENYIEEQTILSALVSRPVVGFSGLALLLLALFTFLFASGCAPVEATAGTVVVVAEDGIGATELAGRYRIYDTGYPSIIDLAADGTFRRAASEKGVEEAPIDMGQWAIEDEVLTLTSVESVSNCGVGKTGRYQISHYETGGYLFQRLSEECEARVGFVPSAEVHPLQPTGLLCELASGELCANK